MPAHTRTVCLEFFGQARDAIPSIVEIKRLPRCSPKAKPRRRDARRASSIWTSAICARSATRPSPSARPAEDGAARRHRRRRRRRGGAPPPRRWCASPTPAAARASSPSAPRRAANSGSTAPRTAAIAKHTNAFKINEDVVIPLERLGEYTDAIERINIELSIANKLAAARCARRVFCRANCRSPSTAKPAGARVPGRPARGARELLARVRARWRYLLEPSTCRWPRRAPTRCPASPPDARGASVFSRAAGPQHPRVSWKHEVRAELRQFSRPRFAPDPRGLRRDAQARPAWPRVRRAAHARGRRQRAHQHPGQLRQLRDAAGRQRRGGAHHAAGARSTA